ncbi:DUF1572 family protein [Sediminibacterium soli]|uniref:DUF1572 family protein n=1 Tax=Sediminibacterium soli TaxID=2698829 RepID=UPI00137B56AC|nr:DUF1572 family protein [Sediminibacterium soli]NCI46907.1 DUF1572 domain-containing protein [Sediminibacterium soli]
MLFEEGFLKDVIKRFRSYKELGDKTFVQLEEKDFFYQPGTASNSIAVTVKHMHGNMLSRWTNFLTEDGEKTWRRRDAEFEEGPGSREHILALWEEGWQCLFTTLESLSPADLTRTVTIRTEPLQAYDAILRQLAHYPYHVGQIVYIGRMIRNENWQSLSIPKGDSLQYLEKVKGEQKKS